MTNLPARGNVYKPFTPNFVTGATSSTGPINSGICKVIHLPGCDTVVDPNTGKPVSSSCKIGKYELPFPCWVGIGIDILVLLVALKH